MKNSNHFTLFLLCLSMIAIILFMGVKNVITPPQTVSAEIPSSADKAEPIKKDETTQPEEFPRTEQPTEYAETEPEQVSMNETLFIGDSRTVGLMEYSDLKEADFFCSVGMSVFNIHKNPVSVPNMGKLTLTELLDNKNYNKIYVMLGINEIGYKFESILSKYEELIDFIREKEPEALIIIQGNLHVTQSRSDSDDTFNNNAINNLNTALSNFADNENIFYLDANSLFDDENGALSKDKSSDDTHLYAKYYAEWGQWIIEQTSLIMGEDNS